MKNRIIDMIARNSPKHIAGFFWSLLSYNLSKKANSVVLASYPRSGNTWARYFISYMASMDPNICRSDLNKYVPDLHQISPSAIGQREFLALKSHSYPSRSYKKFIYLVRDPRDIALSYYSFMQNRQMYVGNRYQFIDQWIRSRFYPGAWGDHVRSWRRYGAKAEGLFLRYEDMVTDPRGQFENVAHFLGVRNVSDAVDFAADKATFEKFKSEEIYDGRNVKGQKERWRSLLFEDEVRMLQDAWGMEMANFSYALE